MSHSLTLSDLLKAIAVIAIWGANAAISKLAVPQIPALSFLVIRFALTALVFLPFIDWKRDYIVSTFKIAMLLNVFHYGLIFSSLPYLDASALVLIQQIQVPAAVLVGALVFGEKFDVKVALGIAAGFAGLVLIKSVAGVTAIGFTLAFFGSVAWAFASTEMKRHDNLPLPAFMGLTTLFSLPFLGLAAYSQDKTLLDHLKTAHWGVVGFVLAYQIILGCWAMMAWKKLMVTYPVKTIVPLTLLQPLFGVIGGVLLFSDPLNYKMILGGLITMAGVATVILTRKPKPMVD